MKVLSQAHESMCSSGSKSVEIFTLLVHKGLPSSAYLIFQETSSLGIADPRSSLDPLFPIFPTHRFSKHGQNSLCRGVRPVSKYPVSHLCGCMTV